VTTGHDGEFPIPVRTDTYGCVESQPWDATPLQPVPGVDDIVLVASGKGGVGKSTVTVNLACALAAQGLRIGVLDADLYGPSIARMLGTGEGLEHDQEGRTIPSYAHGVHSVSVANLIPPEAALVWKGPLVAQALLQMFREVAWPSLDVLLVDLPPGTGDVQLTILEQIPVTGAVIVSTPQRLALLDAERGIAMFHGLDIPVFGLIENMRGYCCPCCGEEQPLFPKQGLEALCKRRHVPYLAGIPLDPAAQQLADQGTPLVRALPEAKTSQIFNHLATQVNQAVDLERRAQLRRSQQQTQTGHEQFWEDLLDS